MADTLPTFFFSHGSPRTLVDETDTTRFYQKVAAYAKKEGVQGIVWMCMSPFVYVNHHIIHSSNQRPIGKHITTV